MFSTSLSSSQIIALRHFLSVVELVCPLFDEQTKKLKISSTAVNDGVQRVAISVTVVNNGQKDKIEASILMVKHSTSPWQPRGKNRITRPGGNFIEFKYHAGTYYLCKDGIQAEVQMPYRGAICWEKTSQNDKVS